MAGIAVVTSATVSWMDWDDVRGIVDVRDSDK